MKAAPVSRELWTCASCGRSFANRNQSHACGPLDLEHHFARKPQAVRDLYETFVETLRRLGPVTILPEKTRIAFQTRMSFAQVTPRKHELAGHLVLARRCASAKFYKVETISPRNHVHCFRLQSVAFIDAEFVALLGEAYGVGEQRHLARSQPRSPTT